MSQKLATKKKIKSICVPQNIAFLRTTFPKLVFPFGYKDIEILLAPRLTTSLKDHQVLSWIPAFF